MIRNEAEYEEAKDRLSELESELKNHSLTSKGVQDRTLRAVAESLSMQIRDVRAELGEYEHLNAGKVSAFRAGDLDSFGEAIVKARLARGLSQAELADSVGMDPQQMVRYERDGYQKISLWRLSEITEALGLELDLRARIPRERADHWSVVEELSASRSVQLEGKGTLALQSDQFDAGQDGAAEDGPPPEQGQVRFLLRYAPIEDNDPDIKLRLNSIDNGGAEILSWQPQSREERTTPRYDLSGTVDQAGRSVPVEMDTVYVDFRFSPGAHSMGMFDSVASLTAGPGLGSSPERIRALIPNLSLTARGEAAGLRFRLSRVLEGIEPELASPEEIGRVWPGSILELEKVEAEAGEAVDLQLALGAFGYFLSFWVGRSVHPIAWEAETTGGPVWHIQGWRKPTPLPAEDKQTCLPRTHLVPFLKQAWSTWVELDEEKRKRLQGVVTLYHQILTTSYPILQVALIAMYLERFRDQVLGTSELLPLLGTSKKDKVASKLRNALRTAISDITQLDNEQKEVLLRSLQDDPGKIMALFRKSFKPSLLELHERADLPVDEKELKSFINERDTVLHGSWDAERKGTIKTYWLARYGLSILEKLILRSLRYEGEYFDRVRRETKTLPKGEPTW